MFLLNNTSHAQTNYGFESGNLSNWTSSGSDAGVSTGLINANYGGPTWTIRPYGTYMAQLYPSGSVGFDSAVTSLGLTSSENSSIRSFLSANAAGGSPDPTNATWIKRTVTLTAGTTYKFAWNFLATDYAPFNDGSMMTLVHSTNGSITPTLNNNQQRYALLGFTNLGSGNYSVDSYGSTGWQLAQFTVPETGDYILGFATFNMGDTILSPMLFIDELQGTTEMNGQPFAPIAPNAGSNAPSADSGSGPTYSSDITTDQLTALNAARTRLNAIGSSNRIDLYSDGSGNAVTIEQAGGYNRIQGIGGGNARVAGFGTSVNIKQGDTGTGPNLIELYVQGNGNDVTVSQARNVTTGARDGSESNGHYLQLNMTGDVNTVVMRQGNDGGTSSGHFALLTVAGSSNNLTIKQANDNEKRFFGSVNGNSNSMNVAQQGTGNHYLDLSLTGNNNNATVLQTGSGSHRATIALTNSGGASSINLTQQGSTNQVYSVQQICANSAGCSVTVTQQ